MPAGTQVSITAATHDQLPQQLAELSGSGAGYKLEPEGLTFTQPASATLTIARSDLDDPSGTQSAYALVSFSDANGREVLDSDTTATVDGDTITVTAPIQHFSWIARTRSSLLLEFEPAPDPWSVGSTFGSHFIVRNVNPELVTLLDVRGTTLRGAPVDFTPGQDVSFNWGEVAGSAYDVQQYLTFVCASAGTGSYGLHVTATSTLNADTSTPTHLALTATDTETCVEGTVGPRPINTVAPTPEIVVHLQQTIGCEHTQPGVRSELRKKGRVTDASGTPLRGIGIAEVASGPGIIDVGGREDPTLAEATSDESGEFTLVWDINKFGTYTVTVTRIVLPGSVEGALDATSDVSLSYTVTATCTPP